jgi:acyl-CoA reductase-like NAD-dependent aldehyde dehydrogenase
MNQDPKQGEDSPMLKVTSPFDGQTIAELPQADEAAIESALSRAKVLHRTRSSWLSLQERVAVLERTAEMMRREDEELAQQIAREGGKPLIDARIEVARAIDGVKLCAEHIKEHQGRRIALGGTAAASHRVAWTQPEPLGVVVAVSAFNHPLNLIVHQVGPAVATGCPVLVKPADDTPLSCRRFVELLHEAGLPSDWCQFVLPESLALAERMVTDDRVDFFSFIGSARVGWMLKSKLASGTRAALEHGGAAPVIVEADADLDRAVPALLKGGFYHAGQVCVSVQRVFAHADIYPELVERLAAGASELVVGDPLDEATEVGPLIRPREVERVEEWVKEAVAGGGQIRSGGQTLSETCFAPTIIDRPADTARVSVQEVFGPVVCTYDYDRVEAAIEQANALPFAFQAAVFTNDIDRALATAGQLRASAVMVNDHSAYRVDGMPFAGLDHSGYGTGGIPYIIEDMQVEKMVVLHSPSL